MSAVAKIFQNGHSQAVRLPKEFRFDDCSEVFIKKIGDGVLLLPKNSPTVWDTFYANLDNFSDDFMTTREQPDQEREKLF